MDENVERQVVEKEEKKRWPNHFQWILAACSSSLMWSQWVRGWVDFTNWHAIVLHGIRNIDTGKFFCSVNKFLIVTSVTKWLSSLGLIKTYSRPCICYCGCMARLIDFVGIEIRNNCKEWFAFRLNYYWAIDCVNFFFAMVQLFTSTSMLSMVEKQWLQITGRVQYEQLNYCNWWSLYRRTRSFP